MASAPATDRCPLTTDADIVAPDAGAVEGIEFVDLRTNSHGTVNRESPTRALRNRYVTRPSLLPERGFACVALDRPTDPVNIGHALRASFCYGARLLILGGDEIPGALSKIVTDPNRTVRHIPVIRADSVLDAVPEACDLVSVELDPDARPLMDFVHPERACYVFGPENGSLSPEIIERSRHKVMIPTMTALNLGMTVNTVLYDRLAKSWSKSKHRRAHFDSHAGQGQHDGASDTYTGDPTA